MRQDRNHGKQLTFTILWVSLGIITHRYLNDLLPPWFIGGPLFLLGLSTLFGSTFYKTSIRAVAWFMVGLAWANTTASPLLKQTFPKELEKKDVVVQGVITTVPETNPHYSRFDFQVQSMSHEGKPYPFSGLIRLKSYNNHDQFRVNQHWRLTVRLKRPRGYQNPGSHFNYETYLFHNRVQALGYIRQQPVGVLLPKPSVSFVNAFREKVATGVQDQLGYHPHFGILTALLVGIKGDITNDHWQVLQRTGTIHLVAISGLHIGLVSALVMMLSARLWRLTGQKQCRLTAPRFGLVCALLAAVIYALLAGMTIPTRRALAMLSVVVVAAMFNRRPTPLEIISLVLFTVLVVDPLAPLSNGFWLSFGAVTAIILTVTGRYFSSEHNLPQRVAVKARNWVLVQNGIFIGMMPLLLTLFGQVSLISPLANMLAIPVAGLLVVPVSLFGLVLFSVGLHPLAIGVFKFCLFVLDGLWFALEWMSAIDWGLWQVGTVPPTLLIFTIVGVAIWFAPRSLLPRWLGIVWLIPLPLHQSEKLGDSQFRYTMLEVGHGLASVIETQNHVLVYDTGPGSARGMNAGNTVVVPFLISAGIQSIDTVVISHEHNDHIGGYQAVNERFNIERVLVGVKNSVTDARPCEAGERWHWDGVQFDILWPRAGSELTGNNASCVIKVSSSYGSILLTGDIEKQAEAWLAQHMGQHLQADLLQVPHQGSRTSSTSRFLQAVNPTHALVSTGYLNRFAHPHEDVKARYASYEIPLIDTAYSGALSVSFNENITIARYRDSLRGYWLAQPSEPGHATSFRARDSAPRPTVLPDSSPSQ